MSEGARIPVHKRLVARIYLYTVFATLVVAVLAFVIAASLRPTHDSHRGGLSRYFVDRLATLRHDPEALAREAQVMSKAARSSIALFDASGTVLAQVGRDDVVWPNVDLDELTREKSLRLGKGSMAFAVLENDELVAYALTRMPPPPSFPPHIWITLVSALVLLFVVSFFLARSLARPLRALEGTAEKLGNGDLTARVRLETDDEFGKLGQSFDTMAERLEQMVKSQRQLIANVSHELRTPLSRVRVVLDLISDSGEAAATTRTRLAEINRDFEDLERLVDDVLTAARFDVNERGPFPMRSAKLMPLAELIDMARSRFVALYDKSHELVIEAPNEPIYLRVDGPSVRRALGNLLDNARKYSTPGTRIMVRVTRLEAKVAIEVVDQGMGIDGDDLAHLFTPFFRSDRSRTRATGGVGLGLTITKRIIEAHGGAIAVGSTPGGGTTIRFELPVEELTALPAIEEG